MSTRFKQSPSVRVSEDCKATIASLADAMGISQTEVMDRAIDSLRRERFFEQMRQDYEAIAEDQEASTVLADENALFDSATSDGIE